MIHPHRKTKPSPITRDDAGSVMAVVLMIMTLLALGGMTAIHLSRMESWMVRNSGFYRQNLHLAEMAAMEGLREILNERDPDRLRPGSRPWIWRTQDWHQAAAAGIPDHGFAVPQMVTQGAVSIINRRGEAGDGTLRYYFAGWSPVADDSLTRGQSARWQTGKVIGVYDSPRYGRAWVEIGVLKKF